MPTIPRSMKANAAVPPATANVMAPRCLRIHFPDEDAPPGDWIAMIPGANAGPAYSLDDLRIEGETDAAAQSRLDASPLAICGTAEVQGANGYYQVWGMLDPTTKTGYAECWIAMQEEALDTEVLAGVTSLRDALSEVLSRHESEGADAAGVRRAPKRTYRIRIYEPRKPRKRAVRKRQ